MNIRPLHDRVLVRKLQEAEKTKSGLIHLPQTAQQGSQLGLVIAVGEGRSFDGAGRSVSHQKFDNGAKVQSETTYERQKPVVLVGQMVLFGKFSGTEVEVEGDTVFILREDEVIAVLEEPPQELIDRAQKREAVATNLKGKGHGRRVFEERRGEAGAGARAGRVLQPARGQGDADHEPVPGDD